MDNIQTWEEMEISGEWDDYGNMAREFARRHCKAALQAAAENAKVQSLNHDSYPLETGDSLYPDDRASLYQVDKESILNSYSEDNIK